MSNIIGKLTTRKAIEWFELGIRVEQATSLWDETASSEISEAARRAALSRLSRAIRQQQHLPDSTVMMAMARRLMPSVDSSQTYAGRLGETYIELSEIRSELNEMCQHHEDENSCLAWQFGLAVTDGVDEMWSAGTPAYCDAGPERAGEVLTFINPRGPQWGWRNDSRVRELADSLQLNLEQFVPSVPPGDLEDNNLPGIPFRLFWGWHAIEASLVTLKSHVAAKAPRWDSHVKTLFIGKTPVRTFSRKPTQQTITLDAFERAGWPPSIPNPYESGAEQNSAIKHLNAKLSPKLIRFRGPGDTRIAWEYVPDEDT